MKKNTSNKCNQLVSIITPTYNHEKFIEDCIKSVLNQTYSNWEMLIIDDASSDKTGEISQKYAKNDERIKYFRHKENYGIYKLSESYNEILHFSKGEFIAILEGDDLWPEDKLEKQLKLFREDEVVLTWGKGICINEKGNLTGLVLSPKINKKSRNIYENRPLGKILNKLLLGNFIIPAVSIVIRKKSLLAIGGFQQPPDICFADYLTWLELSLQGEFRFSDDILGYWRVHNHQITSQFSKKMFLDTANISSMFLSKQLNHQDEIYYNKKIIINHNNWLIAQYKLANKQSPEARSYLWKVVINGPYLLKIKAMLGLLASFLNIDITVADKLHKKINKIQFLIINKIKIVNPH